MTPATSLYRSARTALGGVALAAALSTVAGMATAQETGSLRAAPPDAEDAFRKNVTLLGVPPATVAPDGLVFASLAWTNKRDGIYDDDPDGSATVGFGVGVGDLFDLQFAAQITSLEDDFGDSGFLDIRASRRLDQGNLPTFLGIGVSNVAPWGDAEDASDETAFSASLTAFPVVNIAGGAFPLMITVGGGNRVRNFGRENGGFAGIGIGLSESFGASVAYNGDNVDLGASFRIPGLDTLGFNAVLSDAFDQDDRQRVILSINWITENVF